MRRTGVALAAALLAGAAPAQDAGRASDRALAPLVACRQTADPRARALCYDAALDRLQQSVASRQLVIVDHEQATQDRRTLFGFGANRTLSEPKPAKVAKVQARAVPAEVVNEIDTTVVSAAANGEFWVLRLATGATWRTIESSNIVTTPKAGTKVHIQRSLMGGFFMRVGNSRAVRAARVG